MDLKPVIVANPHPLVGDGRKYSYVTFLKGETLGEYLQRTGFDVGRGPKSVYVNGQRVPDDKWHLLLPETGDQIVIRTRATGGGNGGKVLRVVAMIALTILTYGAGTAMAAAGYSSMAVAGAQALIMVGGSMIINALLPPPKASMTGVKEKEQSPTYGINAGNNSYNSYGPMIVVFGKHKVVPYFASKPYTTFQGNDQFLSQAFHFGLQPDLDLQAIRIGSTDISNYRDVQINRSTYDGKLSLVSGNVDTLDGFELAQGDGWIQRTTPRDTLHISVDIAARLFHINDRGDEWQETVVYEAQYKPTASSQWQPLGGDYEQRAAHYWSLGRWTTEESIFGGRQVWQQVQYGSTDPNEHAEGEPMEICHREFMHNEGFVQKCETYFWRWITYDMMPWQGRAPNPITKILGTGISQLSGSDPQVPARVTLDVSVVPGQYDIRIKKISEDISSNRSSNKLTVTQIRCTQVDNADYSGQCRLAVQIKATSQLNGTIDQLSAIATAKTYIWKNNAWVKAYTSNPAWWYLMWARGMRDKNYNRLYGECLPDNKIDLEAIKSWAAWCDEKGLTFNWVLDRKMSIDDVYHIIARAGRASKTMQGGKLSVIWDSADIPESNFCTPDNIIAGSFQYSYINTEVADEIIVNFHNEQKDYEPDVVRQKVPGAVQINNPITLDLEGCTVASQAGREANLLAASQYFHRRQYSWEMDIEGATITRGDVVRLTHDLTSWGASGRFLAYQDGRITLDSYIDGVDNAWMSIRSPNNKIAHVRVSPVAGTDGDQVFIVGGWPRGEDGHDLLPKPDGNEIDYIWQYNPTETPGRKVQIKSARPAGGRNVKFEAIDYLREYHESENNAFIHIQTGTGTKALINVFSISASELIIDEVSGRVQVTFTWVLSEKSNSDVHMYVNGASFDSFNTDRYMTSITAVQGDVIDIEVRPTKEGRGLAERYQYTVNGTLFKIPAIQSLTTASEIYGIRLRWTIPVVNYIERTEIWYSERADRDSAHKLTDLAYPQQEYQQSGIRAGQVFYYWVRVVDRFGNIGPFYPAGNGIRGASSTDVKAYSELFKNEFLDSKVGKKLQDSIKVLNSGVATPGSVAHKVEAAVGQAKSEIAQEVAAARGEIGHVSKKVSDLTTAYNRFKASAETKFEAFAGADKALAAKTAALEAKSSTGVNLLKNGGFENGLDGWLGSGYWEVVDDDQYGRYLRLKEQYLTAKGSQVTYQILNNLEPGVKITCSGDFCVEYLDTPHTGIVGASIQFFAGQTMISNHPLTLQNLDVFDDSLRYERALTVLVPETTTETRIRFYKLGAGLNVKSMRVRRLKLELGEQATAYTPDGTLSQAHARIDQTNETLVNAAKSITTQITQVKSEFEGKVAGVERDITAVSNNVSSVANQINTVQASVDRVGTKVDQAVASAQTNSEAIAEANGRMSSAITQKVEILANGQRVFAGTGLGIESAPNGEGFQSSYNVWAERFAVWSGTGTELFSPFVVSKGQVFINDAVIDKLAASKIDATSLSAISSNLGVVYAGIISLNESTVDGWSYIRSGADKWYAQGEGFFFGKNTNENSRWAEINAGDSYLKMYRNGATGGHGAQLKMGGSFYADSSGYMRVEAVDVMGTLQLRGNAVTTHVSGYYTDTIYINAPHGGILTVFAYREGRLSNPSNIVFSDSKVELQLYVGGQHVATDSAWSFNVYRGSTGGDAGTDYLSKYTPSLNIQWSGWVSGNGIEIKAPGARSIVAFLAMR